MARLAAVLIDGEQDDDLTLASIIEVDEALDATTTFVVRVALDVDADDLDLLVDDRLGPDSEVTIVAATGDARACLVRGPVCGQRIRLSHGGAGSVLEAIGADASIAMDREDKVVIWDSGTESEAVEAILGDAGMSADVDSTDATYSTDEVVLVQRESDLAFVRRLARRNGMRFWVTSEEGGTDTGHFVRPDLSADPAGELLINRASPTVERLDIDWDVERPTAVTVIGLDDSGEDIDGSVLESPLSTLGAAGLGSIASGERSVHLAVASGQSASLQARAEGALIEADWFVTARGRTTTALTGWILRPADLIDVQGAGSRFSGTWLCTRVSHLIDDASHTMSFELARNGWGA